MARKSVSADQIFETVDGHTYSLRLSPYSEHTLSASAPRLFDLLRDGEPIGSVEARGTSMWYVFVRDRTGRRYTQKNARGAILAAALWDSRHLPPPKPLWPGYDEKLREIADTPSSLS